MKDNGISTQMPLLMKQYIMHKNGGRKTRENSDPSPPPKRKKNKTVFLRTKSTDEKNATH